MTIQQLQVDGVRLAVMSSRIDGVLRMMANTLLRTARSTVINTGKDFSCALVTADGELVSAASSLPIHVVSGPDLAASYVKRMHPDLRAGDAFLHNDPYNGNSHAADMMVIVPVVDSDGVHRFTIASKAHVADCGNAKPTTLDITARDVYEEGALIFPAVKVQEDYEDVDDVIRMCRTRIRVADKWYGDYLAQLGAARVAEREILAMGEEFGWDEVGEFVQDWFDYSEQRMSEAIRDLPAGKAAATTWHDPVGDLITEPIPIIATVEVTAEGRVVVDLRDNVDCLPVGLNTTESTAIGAAVSGVFYALGRSIPANAGSKRCVDVLLRENCAIGIPRFPASCSLATTDLANRAAGAVLLALAEMDGETGMAEPGGMLPIVAGQLSGLDERWGRRPYIDMIVTGTTAGPATPTTDGWLLFGGAAVGGMIQRDSTEADELQMPLVVWTDQILPDSEGAGRRRGAPSSHMEIACATSEPIDLVWSSDGQVKPAQGVRGGDTGGPARQFLRRADGRLEELPQFGRVRIEPGERIVSHSTGGGGYGDPFEREPERVLADVREGWITPRRAREAYGVHVTSDGVLDEELTALLRAD